MFALHEHKTADGSVHWDLLIEIAGQELLATWRLAANPLTVPGEIAAERLPDHRRMYLDYEGPLTRQRGEVRRLDRGEARVSSCSDECMEIELRGRALRGKFIIQHVPATWFGRSKSR